MPYMRVESGPQRGHRFRISPPGPIVFGRDLEADFPLFDRKASRRHFRIELLDRGYQLRDLASRGGTWVNDTRTPLRLLQRGDRVRAGDTTLTLELDDEADPLLGQELAGYQILERMGRGGMGTVYRALQVRLDRYVALKVLSASLTLDAKLTSLFIREARAAAELSHPHIVRVYDVNFWEGTLFYVMEFMARGSVANLLDRRGALPIAEALGIAREAAAGLEYAEEIGFVHRDIKPANLMVHESGRVKVGDLGIALRLKDGSPLRSGSISGSPLYMPPEQILGREVDSRSDLYSLGATLHEMLTGASPFRRKGIKEIFLAHLREPPQSVRDSRPEVPEGVAALVLRLLAKDRLARPAGARAVRLELEALLEAAPKAATPRTTGPPRRGQPLLVQLGWLLFWLLVAAGAGFVGGVVYREAERMEEGSRRRIEGLQELLDRADANLDEGQLESAHDLLEQVSKEKGTEEEWRVLLPRIQSLERRLDRRKGPRGGGASEDRPR